MRKRSYLHLVFGCASLFIVMVLLGTAVQLFAPSVANAQEIPGASYTGTHSGGGTVTFAVSADGKRVTGFTATNVPGGVCGRINIRVAWDTGIAIVNHTFTVEGPDLSLRGSFRAAGAAQGTFAVHHTSPGSDPCNSGTLSWSATTSVPGPAPTQTPTARPRTPTPPARTPTLPPTPAGLPIERQLGACLTATEAAWTLDNTSKQWLGYQPGAPAELQDLREFVSGGAYFVKTSNDCTITSGPYKIALTADWNLFGWR